MNDNNHLLSFVLGAAIGGAAAYYLSKHQDEIVDKLQEGIADRLHDLEETLHIDHAALIEKARNRLDTLSGTLQSTIQRYTSTQEKAPEDEIAAIMQELSRLREEVKALSTNPS